MLSYMTIFETFKKSVQLSSPPDHLSQYLLALWYDGKNDWQTAHSIIQDIEDKDGAWIHAYLHRKEGDKGNAGYWYHRAGKPMPVYSLEKEWEEIVSALLC
jgi:hypothetical protein